MEFIGRESGVGRQKRRRKGGKRMANGFICGEGGGHMDAVGRLTQQCCQPHSTQTSHDPNGGANPREQ